MISSTNSPPGKRNQALRSTMNVWNHESQRDYPKYAVKQQPAPAPGAAGLLWIGGNVGFDFAEDKCFFTVQENGISAGWTISQVMTRILIAYKYQAEQSHIINRCAT